MRGDDDTEFLCQLQCVIKFLVADTKRALVSEEDLEAAVAAANDLLLVPGSDLLILELDGSLGGPCAPAN